MCDTTAKELMKCCLSGVIPSIPVIADYFGNAETEIDLIIVLGIYKGLVKYKSVNLELLNNCFHSNRLDELVHARYKTEPNGLTTFSRQETSNSKV